MSQSRSENPADHALEIRESRGASLAFVRPNYQGVARNPLVISHLPLGAHKYQISGLVRPSTNSGLCLPSNPHPTTYNLPDDARLHFVRHHCPSLTSNPFAMSNLSLGAHKRQNSSPLRHRSTPRLSHNPHPTTYNPTFATISPTMAIQTLFGAVSPEPNLLDRLKAGVQKTRAGLMDRLGDVFAGRKQIDADVLDELESALYTADIGVKTTEEILESVKERVDRRMIGNAAELKDLIRQHIVEVLEATERPVPHVDEPPAVVMVVGVNGSGKTTTIGKLTNLFKSEGRSVLLCAADTFRAAAIEQLEIWGERTDTKVIRQSTGADPSAVLFDALTAAKSRAVDYVIVDTAGRLHTKTNLMAELEKMRRTAAKVIPTAPHEVLLVLDATTGQNGLEQARKFTESIGVTGIVLTKLDGTAKGGIVVAISRELNLPIRYVGVGEKVDDLLPFDPQEFVASIFEP
jgi:fused signal recognition particle receptor